MRTGLAPVRRADRARGAGLADGARQRGRTSSSAPRGYSSERGPDPLLERRAAGIDRDAVERAQVTREVGSESTDDAARRRRCAGTSARRSDARGPPAGGPSGRRSRARRDGRREPPRRCARSATGARSGGWSLQYSSARKSGVIRPPTTNGRRRRKRTARCSAATRIGSLTSTPPPGARSAIRAATLTSWPTRSPARDDAAPLWMPIRSPTPGRRAATCCIASAAATASAGGGKTAIRPSPSRFSICPPCQRSAGSTARSCRSQQAERGPVAQRGGVGGEAGDVGEHQRDGTAARHAEWKQPGHPLDRARRSLMTRQPRAAADIGVKFHVGPPAVLQGTECASRRPRSLGSPSGTAPRSNATSAGSSATTPTHRTPARRRSCARNARSHGWCRDRTRARGSIGSPPTAARNAARGRSRPDGADRRRRPRRPAGRRHSHSGGPHAAPCRRPRRRGASAPPARRARPATVPGPRLRRDRRDARRHGGRRTRERLPGAEEASQRPRR